MVWYVWLLILAFLFLVFYLVITSNDVFAKDEDILNSPRTLRIRLGQRNERGEFDKVKDLSFRDYYLSMLNQAYYNRWYAGYRRMRLRKHIRQTLKFLKDEW